MKTPILSIVVPMKDGTDSDWLQELLKVKGNVEFILAYPPGASLFSVEDERLSQIFCPLDGEFIKRITALLNARGEYVLSVNSDEYVHPDMLNITEKYFKAFPESMFFRLRDVKFPYSQAPVGKPWDSFPEIEDISIKGKTEKEEEEKFMMREIPISPLENPLRVIGLFTGRTDHKGPHQENFDKKVWKTHLIHSTLEKSVRTLNLFGPFKYVPFWTADRFNGLSVQANFYEPGKIAGHWLPMPEQLRTEDNPPSKNFRKNRRYVLTEILLLRMFPKVPYLWNLTIFDYTGMLLIWFPRDSFRYLKYKLGLKRDRGA